MAYLLFATKGNKKQMYNPHLINGTKGKAEKIAKRVRHSTKGSGYQIHIKKVKSLNK